MHGRASLFSLFRFRAYRAEVRCLFYRITQKMQGVLFGIVVCLSVYIVFCVQSGRPAAAVEFPVFPKRKEAAVMTKTTKKAMNTMMTAACAGAAFCCACAASHTVILSVLGAIIMASIIICALVLVLLVLAASAHTPLARITA